MAPLPFKRILCVEPHPDDMLVISAGTAARLCREGGEVFVLTLTTGGAAAASREEDEKMRLIRQQESEAADAVLGIRKGNRRMLPFPTRALSAHAQAAYEEILRSIRAVRPDVVISNPSDRRHLDHNFLGSIIEPAVQQAAEPIRVKELGEPVVTRLWLGESCHRPLSDVNVYVDISSVLDLKLKALHTQASQDGILGSDIDESVTAVAAFRGHQAGVTYAEAFREVFVYPRPL
mgnify:CR=1 FL=1